MVDLPKNINGVEYQTQVVYYCVLGSDLCLVDVLIKLDANGKGFDFDVLKKWLNEEIEGKKSTQEGITSDIQKHIKSSIGAEVVVETNSRRTDRGYQAKVIAS